MTGEQFEGLVRRLEGYAAKHPGAYHVRLVLLALLGYAYLLLVLAVLVALVGLLVMAVVTGHAQYAVVKLGWILVAFAAVIVRALWVTIPTPEGIRLDRAQAPRLFGLIDELTTALRAPRFHHVLIDGDLNAAVAQRPRLGMLGWQENHLIVGLPLLQALTPGQFRAVLAHELGHLSGNHGRLGVWIYRVRQTWSQLLARLQESRHWGSAVFERFLNWYAPFFDAYSFVLARAHENDADRRAAQLAGTREAGETLIAIALKARLLSATLWPEVYRRADSEPEPPASLLTPMAPALRAGPPPEDADQWLEQALAVETGYADTHPALRDRLVTVGCAPARGSAEAAEWRPELPAPVTEDAAGHFLGQQAGDLAAQLDQAWRAGVADGWKRRHTYVTESQARLKELEAKANEAPLAPGEAWDRARLSVEFREKDVAVPLLRAFVEAQPDHARGRYLLGQMLLEGGDETGIGHVERAMERDADAVLPGCELVFGFLQGQGKAEDAERYRERATKHYELLHKAQEERAGLSAKDTFEAHGIPAEAVQALCSQIAGHERVGAAYLARKAVKLLPERPLYVLGVVPHAAWYRFEGDNANGELLQRLTKEVQFPGEALVVILNANNKALMKHLVQVPGALVYRRTG